VRSSPGTLRQEVDVFIQQESLHYRNHIQFNKAVSTNDPDIKPIEKRLADDYADFLKNRSLQFNLAYCEGFESWSVIPMTTMFLDFKELWEGSHPKVEAFWKWHFAEEHEHRSTVHDTYHALFGRGPRAYAFRIWGFWFASRHMMAAAHAIADVLLKKDRQGMTAKELGQSKAREQRVKELQRKNWVRHALTINSPFYNPARRVAPPEVMAILELDRAYSPIVGSVSTVRAPAR